MLKAVARFVCLPMQNDHQRQVKMQELDRAREALNLIAPAVTRSQCTAAIGGSWYGDTPVTDPSPVPAVGVQTPCPTLTRRFGGSKRSPRTASSTSCYAQAHVECLQRGALTVRSHCHRTAAGRLGTTCPICSRRLKTTGAGSRRTSWGQLVRPRD